MYLGCYKKFDNFIEYPIFYLQRFYRRFEGYIVLYMYEFVRYINTNTVQNILLWVSYIINVYEIPSTINKPFTVEKIVLSYWVTWFNVTLTKFLRRRDYIKNCLTTLATGIRFNALRLKYVITFETELQL